jgi:hypothetical protein
MKDDDARDNPRPMSEADRRLWREYNRNVRPAPETMSGIYTPQDYLDDAVEASRVAALVERVRVCPHGAMHSGLVCPACGVTTRVLALLRQERSDAPLHDWARSRVQSGEA